MPSQGQLHNLLGSMQNKKRWRPLFKKSGKIPQIFVLFCYIVSIALSPPSLSSLSFHNLPTALCVPCSLDKRSLSQVPRLSQEKWSEPNRRGSSPRIGGEEAELCPGLLSLELTAEGTAFPTHSFFFWETGTWQQWIQLPPLLRWFSGLSTENWKRNLTSWTFPNTHF